MKQILKFCLSLIFFCALSGAALAYVNKITAAPREKAEQSERTDNLKLILPADSSDTKEGKKFSEVQFFEAYDATGKLLAYAAEGVSRKGFGGELRVLAGISLEGRILGVLVSKNSETPGIGSSVTDRKARLSLWKVLAGKHELDPFPANKYLDSFTDRLLGKNLSSGSSSDDIVYVSGATISSQAVHDAVNSISLAWQELYSSSNLENN